ncbi:MAG: hypothetical protein PHX86_05435 [Caldisericia bacterium]|nr:hypothetical protein [Caldisericia bacterium]
MKNQKNYLFLLISCIFVVFLYGCQGEIITNEEVPVNSTGTMSSVYYCLGPYGGRIDCIAASNHDARFILASSSEHAFVTKDGGSQWNHIPLENSRIASVSFHPSIDSTCYILDQDALYMSTDFGKTWQVQTISDLMMKPFYQLEVHPSGSLFISCSTGLFVQEKQLSAWKQIYICNEGEAPLEKCSIAQTNEKHISAISGGKNVYQTKDGGLSWKKIETSVFKDRLLTDIAIHPSSTSFIAILYPGGVIGSLDEGETWSYETAVPLTVPAYVLTLTKTGIMYVGTQNGVWQSLDQGYTWGFIPTLQEPVYAIESGFSEQVLFAGTNQHFYSYSLTDQKWKTSSEGISANTVKNVSIHPLESEQMIVVQRDQKVLALFRPYEEWNDLLQKDSYEFYFGSPDESLTWFGVKDNVLYKSEEGVQNWQHYSSIPSSSIVYEVWIHPQMTSVWFAGTKEDKVSPGDGLWMSTNAGLQWQKVEPAFTENTLLTLCFDPVDDRVIYGLGKTIFGEKKLFKSEDRGLHWNALEEETSLQWVETDASRSGVMWGITTDGKFLSSTDFGETWIEKIDFSKEYPTHYFKYPSGFQIKSTHEEGSCILHLYRGIFFHISENGESCVSIDGVPDASFYSMQMHPKKKNIMYIASDLGLIECTLDKGVAH